MNAEQKSMVADLRQCRFHPGSFDKRFVNDMTYQGDKELTPRQDWFLRRTYWRYRAQIGHKNNKPSDFDNPPAKVAAPVVMDTEFENKAGMIVCYGPVSVASIAADELERLAAWNAGQPRKVTP